jgi:hypothetical protein
MFGDRTDQKIPHKKAVNHDGFSVSATRNQRRVSSTPDSM